MTVGYCIYHSKYMDADEAKFKSCKRKANTKRICKYFVSMRTKQTYKNDTTYLSTRR